MEPRDRHAPGSRGHGRPGETDPALARTIESLRRLATNRPALATPAASLERVLLATFDPAHRAGSIDIALHADASLLVEGWRAGVPAFQVGDGPPVPAPERLLARAVAIARAVEPDHRDATPLRSALASGKIDIGNWSRLALSDRCELVERSALELGVDASLARSVLRLALLPELARYSDRLAEIRGNQAWPHGVCPHCGGPPLLAESRGLEQARRIRCGVCAGDWPGERLACPHCGESDHHQLSYRYVDGELERQRLVLCARCGGRLVVMATLGPLSAADLLAAELATAHLAALGDLDPEGVDSGSTSD